VRRLLATTLLLAAVPAAAQARFYDGGVAAATPQRFPIAGPWHWGGADTHFGDRGGEHAGEDVMARCGTPIVAAGAGRVVFVDSDGAAGNYLVVRGAREDHVYMHLLHRPKVGEHDRVEAGQPLGAVGRSGNASACHLHFEIWTAPGWYDGGKARDPRPDLARWAS
jgi:murein DD-endopeptidase MepM/ murein hydrolase activator NlpD